MWRESETSMPFILYCFDFRLPLQIDKTYKMKRLQTLLLLMVLAVSAWADEVPTISPSVVFTDLEGNEDTSTEFSGSAPIHAVLSANPENVGAYEAHFEWRFYTQGNEDNPYLVRYEQDTQYDFNTSGTHMVVCYATFTLGTDTVAYTKEYWNETGPIRVTISESKLEMPNAFSPNGDGINDVYKPKSGYKSITEFHAYIFNRWGQKLYEWTDPATGWDGKFNGKDVKQGVYFCLVKAKGADGKTYNIKKDVNLLRGYDETSTSSSQD